MNPPAPAPTATSGDTVDLSLLGQPFRARGDAAVVGEVRRLLDCFVVPTDRRADPPVVTVSRTPAGYVVGEVGRPDVASTAGDVAGATTQVLTVLNAAALTGTGCLAVHAGVVARHGRAVAFPARSGRGKSTLTAACLRAGLDYVSDEALCLAWDGAGVLPYPRPLELSDWSRAAVGLCPAPGGRPVTAAELGAGLARLPLVLDHVVLPCRHAAAAGVAASAEVTLEPVSRQQGAQALLTRSFNHWRDPARAFDLAHEVVSRCRVWRLRLGDPNRAAALLSDLLA